MTRRRFRTLVGMFTAMTLATAAGPRTTALPPGHGEAPGAVVELPTFGMGGGATDINQWGVISGQTDTDSGWARAFRSWPHGPLQLLPPVTSHPYSQAMGINDFGDLVVGGFRDDGTDGTFAVIGGRVTDTRLRFAEDINNRRVIAGWTRQQAALWRDGRIDLLLTPGMPADDETGTWWSGALGGLNDRGQAAGFYVGEDQTPHAVRWEPDGTVTEIGPGTPTAINEAGDVVGWGYNSPNFYWREDVGVMAVDIYALAVNDVGQLAGICGNNTSDQDACVWSEAGGTVRLPKPVPGYARATAVNDLGEVVGHLGDAEQRGHAWWWYVPPDVGAIFDGLTRLLEMARDDGVLNRGRYQVVARAVRTAAQAWGAGHPERAAVELGTAARHLRSGRQGAADGRERLVHIEALASRLALRLTAP